MIGTASSPRKFLRLELEFVTPAFVGGNEHHAEWRSASIRGQLRWWLRAIAPGSVDEVRAAEKRIFGSTEQASNVRVLVSPIPDKDRGDLGPCRWGPSMTAVTVAETWGDATQATIKRLTLKKSPSSNPVHYLGYGPLLWNNDNKRVEVSRSYIRDGASATVEIRWTRLTATLEELLTLTVACWVHLGGVGARSRRGFGSLTCTKCETNADLRLGNFLQPPSMRDLISVVMKSDGPPPALWSRFSPAARVFVAREHWKNWEDALASVGAWMIAYRRRYGASSDLRTLPVKGSGLDYEWGAPNGRHRRQGIPDRAGFGLPLPFGKHAETVVWGDPHHDHRRASPLLVHIAKVAGEYFPVLTYLPAPLMPLKQALRFKGPGPQPTPPSPPFDVITAFLDDLNSKNLVEEVR